MRNTRPRVGLPLGWRYELLKGERQLFRQTHGCGFLRVARASSVRLRLWHIYNARRARGRAFARCFTPIQLINHQTRPSRAGFIRIVTGKDVFSRVIIRIAAPPASGVKAIEVRSAPLAPYPALVADPRCECGDNLAILAPGPRCLVRQLTAKFAPIVCQDFPVQPPL